MLCKSLSSVANGKNRRYFSRAVSRNPNKKSTYLLWQLLPVMADSSLLGLHDLGHEKRCFIFQSGQ